MRDETAYAFGCLRDCERCGKSFQPAHRKAWYCSRECGIAARNEASRGRARRKWGKVEIDCEFCGKTFEAFQSEVGRNRRFCSRECFFASEPLSPALRPGAADKIAAAKITHGRQAKRAGERRRQLENAGFTLKAKGETCCRNCGRSDVHMNLHHAIPRSMWKAGICEPLNGIPLCMRCHMGWHARRTPIYRDVFHADEWECISNADLLGQDVTAWLDERYPVRPEEAAA